MRIQFLNGGLANQVFQYIFYRYGELSNPGQEPWFLDDSSFFVQKMHNGYELEKVFGIKPNLLSNVFDEDVWEEFIRNKKNGISVPQMFKNMGTDIIMYAEVDNHKEWNPFDGEVYQAAVPNAFHSELVHLNYPNIYYHGYWINAKWLIAYKDVILKELKFPQITLPSAQEYANRIMTEPSAAMHVRRGDYVELGWDMPTDYYERNLFELSKSTPSYTVFVFSDDLPWCQEHAKELGLHHASKVFFVDGNRGENSYIDMQLMSMCQVMIPSKSAFCYLATLLNRRLVSCYNPFDREIITV